MLLMYVFTNFQNTMLLIDMSETGQGYDGDSSGHEQSRTVRSLAISSSPHRSLHHIENQPPVTLDFVGMPPPRFPSEWQIPKPQNGGVLKKLRRPTETRLPLELDNKGRPTKAVVLGPKHVVHVRR